MVEAHSSVTDLQAIAGSAAMRTAVALGDDVVAKLRDHMRASGVTSEQAINDRLRVALEPPTEEAATPFVVRSRPMQLRDGMELDDTEGLLDFLDGPARR